MGKTEFLLPFIKPLEWERRSQSLYDPSSKLMLLAPHRLQRPNETQLNQHKTYRWLSKPPSDNQRYARRRVGNGERDPSTCRGDPGRAACLCPAPRLAARLGRQRRGGQRSGRYGSRLAALQADTAPASACEAANASARMCARLAFEADPERCEGCRSLERLQEFKLSYRAGEEREYLLRRSRPLARRRHARGCSP